MSKTSVVVTGTVIALGIYDLYAYSIGGVELSISRFMQDAGLNSPFIVFTVGFICGHIFGYMPPRKKN